MNYHKLINLNQLKRRTEKLVEDLNNIIKNDKFSDIFEFAFDKFYNTNGEKYFGELRNNLMEGKGILFYRNGIQLFKNWSIHKKRKFK